MTAVENDYSIDTMSKNTKLFLAGGITNCSDHQAMMINLIQRFDEMHKCLNLTVYNPRRKTFNMNDPHASEEQICWEYEKLKSADVISYWFDAGSLNPIVLLELGAYCLSSNKPCFIGVDPKYERKSDVLIQTKLARPKVEIVSSVTELTSQVLHYLVMSAGGEFKI